MKAVAVFPGTKEIKLIDHPRPAKPGATEVRVRMLEVGVCGTDREIAAFEHGTPPSESDYLVIGHESLGEVVEVGTDVSRVDVGDLVVVMVRRPCFHQDCLACRSGRQDFCYTGDFTERGIKLAHGFMTETVVDDERYMNVVPHELREVGVLVEPLTIAEKALAEVWQVQGRLPWGPRRPHDAQAGPRHRAVVLGAGPVGLLGAVALVAGGFQTWVYSREPADGARARLVASIGATYVSSLTASVDQLAEQVGNIDLVYEAVGASRLAFDMMRVVGANGVFVFTGVPGRKGPIDVDTDLIMRNLVLRNQVVFGSVNAGRQAYEAAIRDLGRFMKRWPDAVRGLITGRFPIEAHRDRLLGRSDGIKSVIVIHEGPGVTSRE